MNGRETWPLHGRLRGRDWSRARAAAFKLYGTRCWMCGHHGADTIDHLIEVDKGGTNALTNLRPAHGRKRPDLGCIGNFARSNLKAKPTPGLGSASRTW